MKTQDFCDKHLACPDGRAWALAVSDDMAVVWDRLISEKRIDWLLWVAGHTFSKSVLRKLACRFVRETPLSDGRKVWDLLADPRSRSAVEVAESYAEGKATVAELAAAWDAAGAAAAQVKMIAELGNPFPAGEGRNARILS